MKKRIVVLLLMTSLFISFSACKKSGKQEYLASPSPSPQSTLEPTPSPIQTTAPKVSEPLSTEMLTQLNEAFNPYNDAMSGRNLIRFLTCEYNTPTEIDLEEVFHNRIGGDNYATNEELDYLATIGYVIPVDWRDKKWPDGTPYDWDVYFLRVSSMDEILLRRLGITSSEVEKNFEHKWIEEFGAYYMGMSDDTNIHPDGVQFQTGQCIGEDTYVAKYFVNSWMGSLTRGTYSVTFTMKDNDPDTIMFLSNLVIYSQN